MTQMWLAPRPLLTNTIRRPDDLVDYNALLAVCHRGRAVPVSSVRFWEVYSNNHLFVVREKRALDDDKGGRIVGMLTLVTFYVSKGRTGLIEEIAVRADFAEQGIAEALIDTALLWARGLGCTRVTCSK